MARRRRGAGISTLFVVLGLVAVVGGIFTAGFLTGRHWERVRVMTGLVKPQAGKEPERRALAGKPTETPTVPPMTFYQELTAPLSSRPADSSLRRGGAAPLPPVRPPTGRTPGASADSDASSRSTVPVPATPPTVAADSKPGAGGAEPKAEPVTQPRAEAPQSPRPEPARGYTVQVAAYATRAQAESLVQRLGSLGFDGDVSETTTPGGLRYRVRVGTYPTKEAARDAAGRLAAATSLGGFVAAR